MDDSLEQGLTRRNQREVHIPYNGSWEKMYYVCLYSYIICCQSYLHVLYVHESSICLHVHVHVIVISYLLWYVHYMCIISVKSDQVNNIDCAFECVYVYCHAFNVPYSLYNMCMHGIINIWTVHQSVSILSVESQRHLFAQCWWVSFRARLTQLKNHNTMKSESMHILATNQTHARN